MSTIEALASSPTQCLSCSGCLKRPRGRPPKDPWAQWPPCIRPPAPYRVPQFAELEKAHKAHRAQRGTGAKRVKCLFWPFPSLFEALKAATHRGTWRTWRNKGGYREETHGNCITVPRKDPGRTAGSPRAQSPWVKARKEVRPEEALMSTSARIATIATYGSNVLLRPYAEDPMDRPHVSLTEEEAVFLTVQQQARRLSRADQLCVGTRAKKLADLEYLASLVEEPLEELSQSLEETEPLRAMALKSVTNIDDLEALSTILDEDL
jgi:hypothetical protein